MFKVPIVRAAVIALVLPGKLIVPLAFTVPGKLSPPGPKTVNVEPPSTVTLAPAAPLRTAIVWLALLKRAVAPAPTFRLVLPDRLAPAATCSAPALTVVAPV